MKIKNRIYFIINKIVFFFRSIRLILFILILRILYTKVKQALHSDKEAGGPFLRYISGLVY